MIKIQNKETAEIRSVTLGFWKKFINQELYEILEIKDLMLIYQDIARDSQIKKRKCLGIIEKSEALINLKVNPEEFYFENIPDFKNHFNKLHLLENLNSHYLSLLEIIKGVTPGENPSDIEIHGLSKDDIWFLLRILKKKGLITLSDDLASITESGKSFIRQDYFTLDDLEPKNIPNTTHTTPQISIKNVGTVLVKIFNWIVDKIILITVGTASAVIGGLLLICFIHWLLHKGFHL